MTSMARSLEQPTGRERSTAQALSPAGAGENVSGVADLPLDLATASMLIRERGYDLVCRFGHVHATREGQEWHICLLTDLASMPPARLLACLDEALALRVEQSMALFQQT